MDPFVLRLRRTDAAEMRRRFDRWLSHASEPKHVRR